MFSDVGNAGMDPQQSEDNNEGSGGTREPPQSSGKAEKGGRAGLRSSSGNLNKAESKKHGTCKFQRFPIMISGFQCFSFYSFLMQLTRELCIRGARLSPVVLDPTMRLLARTKPCKIWCQSCKTLPSSKAWD